MDEKRKKKFLTKESNPPPPLASHTQLTHSVVGLLLLLLLVLLWKFLHTAAAATVTDILLLYILENSPSAQPHSHGALHALCFPRDFPQNNSTLLHLDSLGSCFPLFFFSILDPRRFSSIRFLSETRIN